MLTNNATRVEHVEASDVRFRLNCNRCKKRYAEYKSWSVPINDMNVAVEAHNMDCKPE